MDKYVVAYGKSITTKKGIKAAGDDVDKSCFVKDEVFDDLVAKGFIQSLAEYKKFVHYTGNAPAPVEAPADEVVEPTPEPPIMKLGATKKVKRY